MQWHRSVSIRILFLIALMGFFVAAYLSYERYQVEKADTTVEMIYDYDNMTVAAPLEGKTREEIFDLFKKSGITTVALYDETGEKILGRGDILIMHGSEFSAKYPNVPGIGTEKTYIQPAERKDGLALYEDLVRNIKLRMRAEDLREFTIAGKPTLEISADWMKFLPMNVGFLPTRVKEATDAGFYVLLRPDNVPHPTKAHVEEFMRAVDCADGKVSGVLSQGKDFFGYSEMSDTVRDELTKRGIPIVLAEAQTQLGFEKMSGALDMVKSSGYNTVRLYAMTQDEVKKISETEAAARFYISDIERNIRMNLFPTYKYAIEGTTLSETNARYIAGTRDRLLNHGFSIGKASKMEPYMPAKSLRAVVLAGALALFSLAFLCVFPIAKPYISMLYGIGLAATQGLFWLTDSLIPLHALALATEISMPILVVTAFMNYCLCKKEEAFENKGFLKLFLEGSMLLWAMGLCSLCGGAYVSGILGDIRFFLEIEIFRGVKLTFVLPIILITLVYIRHFPLLGVPVTTGEEFISFVKKFWNIPVKLGILMAVGFVGFAAYMFVGRSGNNMAPVPAFEIALRRFLEDNMYARPREKEFLFGHPAVYVTLLSLYQKWPQVLHYFLIVAVTIGQGSMVETFAHMRSPYILSLIRGLDGLAAGTLAGFCAVVGICLLIRITQYFGERYDQK